MPFGLSMTDDEPQAPAYDLIQRAISLNATDIHIDPVGHGEFEVRFRIDGLLENYCILDHEIGDRLITRFKTLANLDIANPFEAKEGYLEFPDGRANVQVRVTTAPVEGGEAVCLRLHREDWILRRLDSLGLSDEAADTVAEMLRRREGLIAVTGPTGAGKTTTIYSMLQQLWSDRNELLITSIEDPVELKVPFLRQMNVDDARGRTLYQGLRTMLRLDPDVLFVGEIRDRETAEMAMQAANSGRHVFTTLHSREAAATITALDDMGIGRRSLSDNLVGIICQRLIRKLCPECRTERSVRDDERHMFDQRGRDVPPTVWKPQGCDRCRGTGFRGRTGVFESVVVEDDIREAIERGDSGEAIREIIRSHGTTDLTSQALVKAEEGITTIDEVRSMRSL